MYVIGTAGHIDHGKSTLVKALTGIHPDRLKEEKERQMTIDLGFAWLSLPNGEEIGVVDVPGHRDFIENMLAGVGGIDAALLVIASDEGVMPQTREHLAILDLLQIKALTVVLTKTDLITESEWIDLVEMDVVELLDGTAFAGSPIMRVSAITREGIDSLILQIAAMLSNTSPKVDLNRARLPIDRVFTITGFGTVVTGTLVDGVINVGDEVEILPDGLSAKIRGIQTHKTKATHAVPGSRTAINLSGVNYEDVRRGSVIAAPKKYAPTGRFDAHFRLLKDASSPLKHNRMMKLFVGAKEALVRIRVLGLEQINPGESGWIQVESEEPLILVRADRFVLRRPSPGETIGGGLVIDPHPTRRHKRFAKELINRFESLLNGTPEDILLQLIIESGIESYENIAKKARMPEAELQEILSRLLETGAAKQLEDGKVINGKTTIFSSNWETNISQKAESVLGAYHEENRLRIGQPRQELMNKLGLNQKIFQYLLPIWESTGRVKVNYEKQLVALVDFDAVLTTLEKGKIELLEKKLAANPYQTPSVKETIAEIGDSLFHYLLDQNKIKLLSADVYFEEAVYKKMLAWVKQEIKNKGSISVVDFRDHFRTSRKYALAFLEHLDSIKITKREGDERVLA